MLTETRSHTGSYLDVQSFLKQMMRAQSESDWGRSIEEILDAGGSLLHAGLAFAGEVHENLFELQYRLHNGHAQAFHLPITIHSSVSLETMFRKNLPYCSTSSTDDPLVPPPLKDLLQKNLIAIPINIGVRQIGFLFTDVEASNANDLGNEKRELIEIFQTQATGTLSEITRHSIAKTDVLTGLPGRAGLQHYFDETVGNRWADGFTMLLLAHLDQLGRINEDLGYETGDEAIHVAASCLKELEDSRCKAFRLDGDEFVVLMNAVTPAYALRKAEDLQRDLSAFRIPGGTLTVSIGISYFGPQGPALHSLFYRADEALQMAKQTGGNRIETLRLDLHS